MGDRDTAGYSGTPLARRLGIKEGRRVWLRGAPAGFGDAIRELALPLGFVDVKVCADTEVWSGLKLVVRKELRQE